MDLLYPPVTPDWLDALMAHSWVIMVTRDKQEIWVASIPMKINSKCGILQAVEGCTIGGALANLRALLPKFWKGVITALIRNSQSQIADCRGGCGVKLWYRPDEAAAVVGSAELFAEMRAAGWIKPVVKRRRLVLFDFAQVAKCWARILKGESPGPHARARARVGAGQS